MSHPNNDHSPRRKPRRLYKKVSELLSSMRITNRLQLENVRYVESTPPKHANGADRTKRVKDAKAEAQKEIEEYRKKKQEEYKQFESEVTTAPSSWLYTLADVPSAI